MESQLLYSTQLRFSGQGEPIVTVGLMDNQDVAEITAPAGLRVRLSGPADTSVVLPAGASLRATARDAVPGETHFRVVLEGHQGSDMEAIRAAKKRWKAEGVEVESLELGGIVGFPDRVLDNRAALIVEQRVFTDKIRAEARAEALGEMMTLEEPPRVFADSVRRARGTVVATDSASGITLAQKDMLVVEALDGGPVTVRHVEYGRGYAHHGFEDRRFHGEIIVAIDPGGKLTVVNRLPAEKMLQGIVPSEIFPTAPDAALEAQAISARTELLAKIGIHNRANPYLVCATQMCQVYGGLNKETPGTNAAIQRTRGKMLFDQKGRLVDSVYHADSGGHTENNEYVWPGSPKETLRGVLDAPSDSKLPWKSGDIPTEEQLRTFLTQPSTGFAANTQFTNKAHRWTRYYEPKDLNALVNAKYDIGDVVAIEAIERGISGRARLVRFTGKKDKIEVRGELKVRRLLKNLRSSMFVVDRLDDGRWQFTGGGYGHGVGMSQYGAIGMAESGFTAKQILQYYYTSSKVGQVY